MSSCNSVSDQFLTARLPWWLYLSAFTTLLLCRLAILYLISSSPHAFHDDYLSAVSSSHYSLAMSSCNSVSDQFLTARLPWWLFVSLHYSLAMSSCNSVSDQFLTARLPWWLFVSLHYSLAMSSCNFVFDDWTMVRVQACVENGTCICDVSSVSHPCQDEVYLGWCVEIIQCVPCLCLTGCVYIENACDPQSIRCTNYK